jgi:tetratricopeptide (TPR) repeat protein
MAIFNLAVVYRKNGETQKAIQGFKEVLRRDPHYVNAMTNLGQIYFEENQPEQGMPYYRMAIERYQQMLQSSTTIDAIVSIHDSLSGVYFGQGKLEEARKEILEILRLKPNHPDANFNLAQIYERQGRIQEAADAYQEEIRQNPENFKAYNDLALLLRKEGQFGLAVPLLQKVVSIQPDQFGPHYLLAETLMQSGGSLEAARASAERAVALNPGFKRGYLLLSEIYSRLGMRKEAEQAHRAGLQRG